MEKAFDKTRRTIIKQLHDCQFKGKANLPKLSPALSVSFLCSDNHYQPYTNWKMKYCKFVEGHAFTIAIFGIFEIIETSIRKCLYVDDLTLLYSPRATGMMQGPVDALIKNANNIGFSFWVKKTTCVHFCREQGKHPDLTLSINCVRLHYRPVIKYLGLTADG